MNLLIITFYQYYVPDGTKTENLLVLMRQFIIAIPFLLKLCPRLDRKLFLNWFGFEFSTPFVFTTYIDTFAIIG
jgi:hypothetical protein